MRLARSITILRRRLWRVGAALTRLRPSDLPLLARMVSLVHRYQRLHDTLALPALAASFDERPTMKRAEVDVRRVTYLIDLTMKTVYRDRYCMKRSLLHFHFLRKHDFPATLHFGIRKSDDAVTGHAWVEVNGRPYAERYDPRMRFVETYRYPPSESAAGSAFGPYGQPHDDPDSVQEQYGSATRRAGDS